MLEVKLRPSEENLCTGIKSDAYLCQCNEFPRKVKPTRTEFERLWKLLKDLVSALCREWKKLGNDMRNVQHGIGDGKNKEGLLYYARGWEGESDKLTELLNRMIVFMQELDAEQTEPARPKGSVTPSTTKPQEVVARELAQSADADNIDRSGLVE